MPVFDFTCDGCEIVEEHIVAHDAPYPSCPNCGKTMRRKLGTFSIYGDQVATRPHRWGWEDYRISYPNSKWRTGRLDD